MLSAKGLICGMLAGVFVHFFSMLMGVKVTIGGSLLACVWVTSALSKREGSRG
jgi:hypothetical protein